MNIAALIGIVIAMVVGVSLFSTVTETVSSLNTDEVPSGVASLTQILPIIFVAVIIIGAVAFISGIGRDEKAPKSEPSVQKNPKSLKVKLENASRSYSMFINNLDALLDVKTENRTSSGKIWGLTLTNNTLYIDSRLDWYLTDKDSYKTMFKVVGLNKDDASENRVYLLGKNDTGHPYLVEVSRTLVEASCRECVEWAEHHNKLENIAV